MVLVLNQTLEETSYNRCSRFLLLHLRLYRIVLSLCQRYSCLFCECPIVSLCQIITDLLVVGYMNHNVQTRHLVEEHTDICTRLQVSQRTKHVLEKVSIGYVLLGKHKQLSHCRSL